MSKRLLILAGVLIPLTLIAAALVAPGTTDYAVISEGDGFEVRRYAPHVVAETTAAGPFETADSLAFGLLVDYIQGRNEGGRNLPMTAPVTQQPLDTGAQQWLFQFVMSPEYLMSMLPRPADPAVTLRQVGERTVAVRRYRGNWSEKHYREQEQALLGSLRDAAIQPVGNPVFARYNAPFVPGFLRRNEVIVEVRQP
jgi:hypothetical protein